MTSLITLHTQRERGKVTDVGVLMSLALGKQITSMHTMIFQYKRCSKIPTKKI